MQGLSRDSQGIKAAILKTALLNPANVANFEFFPPSTPQINLIIRFKATFTNIIALLVVIGRVPFELPFADFTNITQGIGSGGMGVGPYRPGLNKEALKLIKFAFHPGELEV